MVTQWARFFYSFMCVKGKFPDWTGFLHRRALFIIGERKKCESSTYLEVAIVKSIVLSSFEEISQAILPFERGVEIIWKTDPVFDWFRVTIANRWVTLTIESPILITYVNKYQRFSFFLLNFAKSRKSLPLKKQVFPFPDQTKAVSMSLGIPAKPTEISFG